MNVYARKRIDRALVCCVALASASMLHGQVLKGPRGSGYTGERCAFICNSLLYSCC